MITTRTETLHNHGQCHSFWNLREWCPQGSCRAKSHGHTGQSWLLLRYQHVAFFPGIPPPHHCQKTKFFKQELLNMFQWIEMFIVVGQPDYMACPQQAWTTLMRLYEEKFHDQPNHLDPSNTNIQKRGLNPECGYKLPILLQANNLSLHILKILFKIYRLPSTTCSGFFELLIQYTTFCAFEVNIVNNANTYAY